MSIIPKWIENLLGAIPSWAVEKDTIEYKDWLVPISPDNPVGIDVSYEDEFLKIKDEIEKISDIQSDVIIEMATVILQTKSKDLRVATYYCYARLKEDGISGFYEGLKILCLILKKFPLPQLWPKKGVQKKRSIDWLCCPKIIDLLEQISFNNEKTKELLFLIVNLQELLAQWDEEIRPDLNALLKHFETVVAKQTSAQLQSHEIKATSADSEHTSAVNNIQSIASISNNSIKSNRELMDSVRNISVFLHQQDDGFWPAFKLVRVLRWGTVSLMPPVDNNNKTKLRAPRKELRNKLINLMQQKDWHKLLDSVELAFLEGANHFWLDLQFYAFKACQELDDTYLMNYDNAIHDLRFFITRINGVINCLFEDGTPFADAETLIWLNMVVLNEPKVDKQADGEKLTNSDNQDNSFWDNLEKETYEMLRLENLEKTFDWLESVPVRNDLISQCQKNLLMAKISDKYQKLDWAFYLLERIDAVISTGKISEWDENFSFDFYVYFYNIVKLKQQKASNHEKEILEFKLKEIKKYLFIQNPTKAIKILFN